MMISCANGKAIEVKDCVQGDGVELVSNQPMNTVNQRFHFVPAKFDKAKGCEYYLRTYCNRAIDASGAKAINGTEIFQYLYHGGANQIWHVEPI